MSIPVTNNTITLIDALNGATDCQTCCIDTYLKLYRFVYKNTNQITEHDRQLLAVMAKNLIDLQTNFVLYRAVVARRLYKLNMNCDMVSCPHTTVLRREVFVPVPSSSIPLGYRGFDIDWQDF